MLAFSKAFIFASSFLSFFSIESREFDRPLLVHQFSPPIFARSCTVKDQPFTFSGVSVGSTAKSFAARFATAGEAIDVPENLTRLPPGI